MSRTHLITCLATAAAAVVLGAAQSSCMTIDCGTGTINKDGTCVPAEDNPSNANCGPGTTLKNGHCETSIVCGENTTPQTDPATGVTMCVGTGGGGGGCTSAFSCPTPSTGKMTICGQILDIVDDTFLQGASPTGKVCGASDTAGPCALTVTPYDAIQFGADPDNATPLPSTEQYIDDCGRFRISNISPMAASYIGIGVEGKTGITTYRRTGIALPTALTKAVPGIPGYVVKATTDTAWSNAAGINTPTFADRGVYMGIFRTTHGTVPVAGVVLMMGGATAPSFDYYFSDPGASSRATVAPAQSSTGANGSGLMIGNPGTLTQYSGTGGEPTGCKWPSDPGEQIPSVVFVQPRIAVLSTSTTTVCP